MRSALVFILLQETKSVMTFHKPRGINPVRTLSSNFDPDLWALGSHTSRNADVKAPSWHSNSLGSSHRNRIRRPLLPSQPASCGLSGCIVNRGNGHKGGTNPTGELITSGLLGRNRRASGMVTLDEQVFSSPHGALNLTTCRYRLLAIVVDPGC